MIRIFAFTLLFYWDFGELGFYRDVTGFKNIAARILKSEV